MNRPNPKANKENSPDKWFDGDVRRVTPDIYYLFPDDEPNPWIWHWCTTHQRWMAQGTANHTLVNKEPLHLEPSLLWECCGLHGWIRSGGWTGA